MHQSCALPSLFPWGFRGLTKTSLVFKALLLIHCQTLQMWESIILQGRFGSLLTSRRDVGVSRLCLNGSVRIQASCSAWDSSAARDSRLPAPEYSRTSLYVMGHLPHLDASSNLFHHTFQQERPPKVCLDRNARQEQPRRSTIPKLTCFLTWWVRKSASLLIKC